MKLSSDLKKDAFLAQAKTMIMQQARCNMTNQADMKKLENTFIKLKKLVDGGIKQPDETEDNLTRSKTFMSST